MTDASSYSVVFTAAARRGMNRLPPSVATALFEHLTGPVAENPHRLGKQLDAPLDNLWSTRCGEYRAIYAIDENGHRINIIAAAHRRDAYRTR